MTNSKVRHFLTLMDLSSLELKSILSRAVELKAALAEGDVITPLSRKTLAMIFTKSSTRTRVSFDTGMRQLGGGSIFLSPNDSQLGRGEPIEDSARVISRMVDAVMIRTDKHQQIELFAEYSAVPVINGLTDDFHPCQLLADLLTFSELRGGISGAKVAWVGDGNNMCHSWMNAAELCGFKLNVATPMDYQPSASIVSARSASIMLTDDPKDAIAGADLVVTDTWASMGQEDEKAKRAIDFAGFCVDDAMMAAANADALFMHCLPAYRGMEVSASVIDGPQSVVWQEAENRLHGQKALLEFLLA
ncbi:MAG TPA: ornithine carbamoyltransferase [Gammaproteobacteria bacterium]|jgi:ornithine carbamoyltransferase|nr:ornithine carbamoyltransferase [Gammaproteobacteria bacterium]